MAEKKIKRIVISTEQTETDLQKTDRPKRVCFFCQSKKGTVTDNPSYTDISVLRRFTTDRAKIMSRAKNGLCSKHQRAVTKQIKYARHLSLLPFVPKV